MRLILTINPGSTSTKVAYFESENEMASESIPHSTAQLQGAATLSAQCGFRLEGIIHFLKAHTIPLSSLNAIAARGGLLKPIQGGVYPVNPAMLADLESNRYGEHPSNLGAIMAHQLATAAGCPAFVVDPVVVDELDDVARITGIPEIRRISLFHALNQKSVARQVARMIGKKVEDCNFIVAHIGGGISVGAHKRGRVVDVNNALNGDGPFSPERGGTLPAFSLAQLCFSGKFTLAQIKRKITGEGGLVAHIGTNHFGELMAMVNAGDPEACLLYRAMAYAISKEIAQHGATLSGKVDRIILTGGIAHNAGFMKLIRERVEFLAPVEVIPGEREMLSLAQGALAVLDGTIQAKDYT
jgi:butyrate kinase